jgi:hypothetical protein
MPSSNKTVTTKKPRPASEPDAAETDSIASTKTTLPQPTKTSLLRAGKTPTQEPQQAYRNALLETLRCERCEGHLVWLSYRLSRIDARFKKKPSASALIEVDAVDSSAKWLQEYGLQGVGLSPYQVCDQGRSPGCIAVHNVRRYLTRVMYPRVLTDTCHGQALKPFAQKAVTPGHVIGNHYKTAVNVWR